MNNNIYNTRDLGEAAALIACKQKLIDIKKVGRICWFIFENRSSCIQLSNEYFFGDLLINAREYHQAITRLKNRIFISS